MARRKKVRTCIRKKRASNGRMVCAKYSTSRKKRKSSTRRKRRKS